MTKKINKMKKLWEFNAIFQQKKMARNTLVYWMGVVGVAGKGPNWMEPYNGDRTIGELVQTLMTHRLGEGKPIHILRFKPGDVGRLYDNNNPYWTHHTKLSEYVNFYGGSPANDVFMVYVF